MARPTSILGEPSRFEIKTMLDDARSTSGNNICLDCGSKDPQWAVVNHGFFVCSRCVTVHREMGPDMAKVKSLQLDLSWTREWLEKLRIGNVKVNVVLEANLPQAYQRPSPDENTCLRRQFILAKHKRREFCLRREDMPMTRRPVSMIDPPYLGGTMMGKLLKRARTREEWLPRQLIMSVTDNSLSYYKPEDQEQEHPLRTIALRSLNAMLLDSDTLGLVGPTILLLVFPENEAERDGTAATSPGSKVKTRHIYLRGFDCQQGQDIVEWYVAIRQAKIVILNLPPTVEPTRRFTHTGWMSKRGKLASDAFRRRWFVLDGNVLRYYENPTDAVALGEITVGRSEHGYGVAEGTPARNRLSDAFFSFTFITPSRSYWFRGVSYEDATQWMRVLDAVIQGTEISEPVGVLNTHV